MQKPTIRQHDGHWIVRDCQGNDVGFDVIQWQAELFYIDEASLYIVKDFERKCDNLVMFSAPTHLSRWECERPPTNPFENKWEQINE